MFLRGLRRFVPAVLLLVLASAAKASSPTELFMLVDRGRYDTVIQKVTQDLKNSPVRDPQEIYLRGFCYYYTSWYAAAEADLKPLGDYSPREKWPKASELVAKIEDVLRAAPTNVREIKSGDRVLFRVYYDKDTELMQTFLEELVKARADVCAFYGSELPATVVFIFDDDKACNAFLNAHWAGSSVVRAEGVMGTLCGGSLTLRTHGPERVGGVGFILRHELSHALHRDLVGSAYIPTWFEEGVAQVCGALGNPKLTDENEGAVLQLAKEGRWLPLAAITGVKSFAAPENLPVSYSQAFAMTRYMIFHYGKETMLKLFLQDLGEGYGVDLAFENSLGVDQAGYYDLWFNVPS